MKVKILSFITALLIGFGSLTFPFFSVNALAETGQQAVVPWVPIFEFIAESLCSWAIGYGADHAVEQLTGSGRKMTDEEYNVASKDWDNCVSYMKSQGCTDSDIENLQSQILGGDLDLSSKSGQAMEKYFAQKGSNVSGAWNDFIQQNANIIDGYNYCPSYWDSESVRDWLFGLAHSPYNINNYFSGPVNTWSKDKITDNTINVFVGTIPCVAGTITNEPEGFRYCVGHYVKEADNMFIFHYDGSVVVDDGRVFVGYNPDYDHYKNKVVFADEKTKQEMQNSGLDDLNFSNVYSDDSFVDTLPVNGKMPTKISPYGGSVPHYYDNTIDNVDSNKNTYNNAPASIDWSKIFDQDDDKNPTFKKIDGYTPPEPKIKDDGSNYDEVIKQLKESNRKLAKILSWLEEFDYDNNGKIKDHRLSPIEPNSPLFNFKLSEKFPFSLPWDMLAILSILKASPVAPKYEFPIMMPDETGKVKRIKLSDDRIGVIHGDKIVIDFTSQDWQDTAKILRWGELVLFICGLCVVFWKYGK